MTSCYLLISPSLPKAELLGAILAISASSSPPWFTTWGQPREGLRAVRDVKGTKEKTFGSWKLLETWMYRFSKNKNLDEMDVRLIILIVNTSKHVQRTYDMWDMIGTSGATPSVFSPSLASGSCTKKCTLPSQGRGHNGSCQTWLFIKTLGPHTWGPRVLDTKVVGKCWQMDLYPLVNEHSYGKWPVIVDFPIKNGDFP